MNKEHPNKNILKPEMVILLWYDSSKRGLFVSIKVFSARVRSLVNFLSLELQNTGISFTTKCSFDNYESFKLFSLAFPKNGLSEQRPLYHTQDVYACKSGNP